MKNKLLLLVLLVLTQSAFALAPVTTNPSYSAGAPYSTTGYPRYATIEETCAWILPKRQITTPTVVGLHSIDTSNQYCKWKNAAGTWIVSDGYRKFLDSTAFCADGTAPDTTKPLAEQCAAVCTYGRVWTLTFPMGTRVPGTSTTTDMKAPTAYLGCSVQLVKVNYCDEDKTSGAVFCNMTLKDNGVAKAAGVVDTVDAAPPSNSAISTVPTFNPATGQGCPTGTVQMGMDSSGTTICGGSGAAPKSAPIPEKTTQAPTTATNPDGSSTVTGISALKNADGSTTTTTTTTTTNQDGSVKTAVSTSTSSATDGTPGIKSPTEADQNDFCKKNPDLAVCRNSTVSGSCDTLTVTGDAILGSIARSAAILNCREKAASDALQASAAYVLGAAVQAGNDPAGATLPTKANGSTWALPSSLDNSGWLGGGSCFSDKSVVVQGHTIVLPFSVMCDYLLVFRAVLMIIALLVSFRLLSGVILRD